MQILGRAPRYLCDKLRIFFFYIRSNWQVICNDFCCDPMCANFCFGFINNLLHTFQPCSTYIESRSPYWILCIIYLYGDVSYTTVRPWSWEHFLSYLQPINIIGKPVLMINFSMYHNFEDKFSRRRNLGWLASQLLDTFTLRMYVQGIWKTENVKIHSFQNSEYWLI